MNGAGRKTSSTFGFGLLDANEFVNIAEQWPGQIPERIHCTYSTGGLVLPILTVASAFGQFCPRSRYRVLNKGNRDIKNDKNDH